MASSLVDSLYYTKDTLSINNNKYVKIFTYSSDKYLKDTKLIKCLLSVKGDTIIPPLYPHDNELYSHYTSLVLEDVNKDGKSDILLGIYSDGNNTVGIYDTYFFDAKKNTFRLVISTNMPIKYLNGSKNYFYSYFNAGCAGVNATSFLFYIKDFSLVKVGEIEEDRCSDEHKVRVYKNDKLIKEFLMSNYEGAEKFWLKNLKLFKQ